MCGRYYRRSDKQKIAEAFHVAQVDDFALPPWDYNVAPTTNQPIIRNSRDTGQRELVLLRWGLIPFFTKSITDVKGLSTINARAETVAKSPATARPFKKRRCLVPPSGFYEWKRLDPKNKQPFAFGLANGKMLAFAGLWDAWKEDSATIEARIRLATERFIVKGTIGAEFDEALVKDMLDREPKWLQSYTIITTEANELMKPVHNRLPVILHPSNFDRWLDRGETDRPPLDLLRPFPADKMEAHKANKAVGNARNNGPEMLNSA